MRTAAAKPAAEPMSLGGAPPRPMAALRACSYQLPAAPAAPGAGMAFNSASLGYVHAMAHQLGGFYDLPHGGRAGALCSSLPGGAAWPMAQQHACLRRFSAAVRCMRAAPCYSHFPAASYMRGLLGGLQACAMRCCCRWSRSSTPR